MIGLMHYIGVGIANGGGTISDMFEPSERAGVFGWYLLGPLLGPTLGPLFGGVSLLKPHLRQLLKKPTAHRRKTRMEMGILDPRHNLRHKHPPRILLPARNLRPGNPRRTPREKSIF